MEIEFREYLREVGLPDDPTEGGKYPLRSHITPELAEESDAWYATSILDYLAERKQALKVGDGRRAEILGGRAVSPSQLRIARFTQGLSQEELARRVDRCRGWIASVERGVHKARVRDADTERIAAALGRSVEEIFNEDVE